MAFRHLLVPTDFSEPANHALRYAMEEATLHNAKVTLLHVQPSDTGTEVYYVSGAQAAGAGLDLVSGGRLGTPPAPAPTVVRRDFSDEALTKLHDLVPEACKGTWQVALAVGRPADAIVRFAQEHHVDLIVMATHGRTGLKHVLLGSVAEKVVQLAPCPVLTVRRTGDA
jgi:nucleotide-binding universal stress UspA family protein